MTTTERLLADLLAKSEIHDQMMRYCRGVDRGDESLVAGAFHPDAEQVHGSTSLVGRAIVDAIVGGGAAIHNVTHFVGNELIEVDGDVARCEFHFMSISVVDRGGQDATRIRAGRYIDSWARRGGVWRIARRVLVDDWSRVDVIVEAAVTPGPTVTSGSRTPSDPVYSPR